MESRLDGPQYQYGRCGDENNLLSAVNRIHFSQSFRPYTDFTIPAPVRLYLEHTSCSGGRERTDIAVDDENEEEYAVNCLLITLKKTMKYTNTSGRISVLPAEV
jgi:hypothetical protein